jgi:GYF domain 2
MSNFWYYAEASETRGPIPFDQLINVLSRLPSPRGVLVWREDFADWTAAENVREIAEKLIRPPPLPIRSSTRVRSPSVTAPTLVVGKADQKSETIARDQQQSSKNELALPADENRITSGRIIFLVVFVMAILVGEYFASQIYGNSAGGIGSLFGELFGAWFLLSLLSWRLRKLPYTAAVVMAVSVLSVAGSNLGKLQGAIAARDAKAALQGITDLKQIDTALSQNPSNTFLQLMAIMKKAAEETDAQITKLSDDIEPPTLSNNTDFAMANRKDLEALRAAAKVAENNATAFMPRYIALQKAERDKAETFASSIHVETNTIKSALVGIDKRHATATAFTSKMMLARYEFYRAYGNCLSYLIGQYGTYNVLNGKFSFSQQPATDQYNALASALDSATKRMADLETERKALIQAQQQQWERFVKEK